MNAKVKPQMSIEDYEKKLFAKHLTPDGASLLPDPTPMAPPVGYKKQPSMVDIIRAQVRDAMLARELAAQGMETFEEADDFNVNDDLDPKSGYEFEDIFEPNSPPPTSPSPAVSPRPGVPPPSGRGEGAEGDLADLPEGADATAAAPAPAKSPPASHPRAGSPKPPRSTST